MKASDFMQRMTALREESHRKDADVVGVHCDADDLLLKMLRALAPLIDDRDALLWGCDEFERMRKWYA